MSVRFYFDVHIHSIITKGLRSRGVDVITAQEDDAAELEDEDLLVRATSLGRVLFTQDDVFYESLQQNSRKAKILQD
jgi:predicted nuclease of predicted toxin-antitoxin system